VYAVMTHCSTGRVVSKERPMAGSAMLTTVASIAAMPEPRIVAVSTQRPAGLA
jgi:hypothetical protein